MVVWDQFGPLCGGNFALLGRCSLLQKVNSRGRGIQLFMRRTRIFQEWVWRLSLHHSQWSKNVGSISERWRLKGPMRATSKPHSALDEDLDLLNLSDFLALCFGARAVFPEVPAEFYAALEWRVLCALRWKCSERTTGLKYEAALWTFQAICRESQSRKQTVCHGCAPSKGRSSIWSAARRAREMCGLCLASDAILSRRAFTKLRVVITIPCAFPYDFKFKIAPTMFFLG